MTPARKWQVRKVGAIWLVIDRDGHVVALCRSHREAIINVDALTCLERASLDWAGHARAELDKLIEAWRNITRAIKDAAAEAVDFVAGLAERSLARRRARRALGRPPRRLDRNVTHTDPRPARPTTVYRRITP